MPGPWGRAIERLRLAKRLTRETVARRARMTPTTYGRIERGQHTQTRKLQDIADVFEVPIEDVLQIRELPTAQKFATTVPSQQGPTHGETDRVSGTATVRELESKIASLEANQSALEEQIVAIVTDRPSRKRVSATRLRKSARLPHARKPR